MSTAADMLEAPEKVRRQVADPAYDLTREQPDSKSKSYCNDCVSELLAAGLEHEAFEVRKQRIPYGRGPGHLIMVTRETDTARIDEALCHLHQRVHGLI